MNLTMAGLVPALALVSFLHILLEAAT